MNWQLFVSLRYLTSKRKEKFISIISLISILGVAVGVAALIIVISVMSGFDDDLKEKIIGTYSHIEVISEYGVSPSPEFTNKIFSTGHVLATSYFLNGQALIRKGDSTIGILVKGIDQNGEPKVNKLGTYITSGSLELRNNGVVIGSELAAKLGVKLGDEVYLISSTYTDGIKFKVTGIFNSGMYEYDMNFAYISIPRAQELLAVKGLVSGMAVKVDSLDNVDKVKKGIQKEIAFPYMVRSWSDLNKNLIAALKLEKTVMFIILALIVMVACFNIASTLIMTVLEKTKDIGILKTIGASNANIMTIFAMQGGAIGIIGTVSGTVLGIALCWCLKTFKFINLPKDIYYIDKLPVKLEIYDISVIVMCSIAISLIATIYPAYKASRLDPVEALRYE